MDAIIAEPNKAGIKVGRSILYLYLKEWSVVQGKAGRNFAERLRGSTLPMSTEARNDFCIVQTPAKATPPITHLGADKRICIPALFPSRLMKGVAVIDWGFEHIHAAIRGCTGINTMASFSQIALSPARAKHRCEEAQYGTTSGSVVGGRSLRSRSCN